MQYLRQHSPLPAFCNLPTNTTVTIKRPQQTKHTLNINIKNYYSNINIEKSSLHKIFNTEYR